ncbi:MAG: flavin reductase family protein [Myxococcota bacterium]
MPVDSGAFRRALAGWASGVSIVTSRARGERQGMTVSAFSSVSLDPPLVLICADRESNTLRLIDASGVFSVSVLAESQASLSARFADKALEELRFDGLECEDGATGCPRIPGAVAYLDCRVVRAIEAGDHMIYLGEVVSAASSETPPLVYLRGRYRALR